jgi:hypothetical protein
MAGGAGKVRVGVSGWRYKSWRADYYPRGLPQKDEPDGALLVNPHDVEAVADAIYKACTMDPQEKARRLALPQERIRAREVHRWVEEFLEAARDARRDQGGDAHPALAPLPRELEPARGPLTLRRYPRVLRAADVPSPRSG